MKATWADISKAKNLLGWRPKTTLREGLKLTVAWYQTNKTWLSAIKL
jgi:nucleoside-diphosphate-sugar epimerase